MSQAPRGNDSDNTRPQRYRIIDEDDVSPNAMIDISEAEKTFTMHLQGGVLLPVVRGASFQVQACECVVLSGPSGAGKSSILKMIFGNYRCGSGSIGIRHKGTQIDLAKAEPRQILSVRRSTIGYVTQFLRAVPRVATIDVVAEPLIAGGMASPDAREKSGQLLRRLNIPERLWALPPSTFSGGEQQRVNIARGFISDLPILLLDEPTASLDAANRAVVVELIAQKKHQGVAMVAIVHDDEIRRLIADRIIDVTSFAAAA
jgi:alpha-D-ribose 1-methylphosphonate 5-triphosphate synthase subunit PhnL